ncbi:hypothetical protein U1Q18_018044 [Sarracenia purpurea var. burkii]
MDNRASVIAAAAIFVALDRKLTKQAVELEINAFSAKGFLQIEDVFSCYNGIQKLDIGELTIPKWRTDASEILRMDFVASKMLCIAMVLSASLELIATNMLIPCVG